MSAAPDPAPRGFAQWFAAFLAQELAPTPYRMRQTLRIATLSAIGAGLAAILQFPDGFGPLTLWRILATQTPVITFPQFALLTGCAGFGESLATVLAGILVEAPWLQISFFAVAGAVSGYLTQVLELSSAWVMIQIGVLSTFFVMTLDAAGAGWSAAYTFAGMTMAYAVVYLADNLFWPETAERALLESLADRLERKRIRLEAVARAYLGAAVNGALKPPPVYTLLATHLGLLKKIGHEQPDPRRQEILLAAVTQGEQLHHAVEVLVYLSRAPAGGGRRDAAREELAAALDAAEAGLAELAERTRAGLAAASPLGASRALAAALARLDARMTALDAAGTEADFGAAENLAAFAAELHRIARLFERKLEPAAPAAGAAPKPGWRTKPGIFAAAGAPHDPQAARHAIKIGLAVTIAFIVGLTAGKGELSVMIWSVLTVGPPTYGAQVRKIILRLAGGIVGGLVAIPTIMILSPNSVSVGAYMIALFAVLLFAAWLATSTSRISYAGVQGGISFMVAVVALAPSVAVTEPLWRVWGITLGLMITTVVFLTLWPEYSGEALLARLPGYFTEALELLPGPDGLPRPREALSAHAIGLARAHTQMLAIAEDARLEGRRAGIDHRAVIDASSALLRIGYRTAEVMAARGLELAGASVRPPAVEAARIAMDAALRDFLAGWRAHFDGPPDSRGARPPYPPADFALRVNERAAALEQLLQAAPAGGGAELMAESEALSRIALRALEMDGALRRIRPA